MIKFGSPQLTTEDYLAVKDVLDSGQLTKGPKNKEFESAWEEEVLKGEGYATCTSSCMGSLHLGALIEDLGEGDEVICPAMSFVATANAIEITGATPVFVDCTLETGNMDICSIEDSITKKTKAIFVVHFAGIPLDMNSVMDIAGRHDLFVVEDCALAPGATIEGKSVGLWGDVGCFSFHPVKHITTGEGGMLVSHYESNVLQANIIKSFGTRSSASWPMSSPLPPSSSQADSNSSFFNPFSSLDEKKIVPTSLTASSVKRPSSRLPQDPPSEIFEYIPQRALSKVLSKTFGRSDATSVAPSRLLQGLFLYRVTFCSSCEKTTLPDVPHTSKETSL